MDTFAARVRLPDEPLMLVDRILEIHGAKGSLGPGRIVTEHDVLPGRLVPRRRPRPGVHRGRGRPGRPLSVLPTWASTAWSAAGAPTGCWMRPCSFTASCRGPGETIRYAIEIEKFLRQGDTYLFLFHFEGTIDGRP